MAVDALVTGLGLANLIALLSVVLIGLPHGAFDGAIAIYLGYSKRLSSLLRFTLLYIGLATLVVYLWLQFPVMSLMVFLVIRILHFGFGDARLSGGWLRWVQAFAHGGVVVAGISQFHRSDVDQIFAYLSGGSATPVWVVIDSISLIVVLSIAIYAWQALRNHRWRAGLVELSLLLFLFSQVPPLVGFAFYFCLIHSTRHVWWIWCFVRSVKPRRELYTQALLLTSLSWSVGGIVFWWCTSVMTMESALLRVVFIGLAALTVPHMILLDGILRRYVFQKTTQNSIR